MSKNIKSFRLWSLALAYGLLWWFPRLSIRESKSSSNIVRIYIQYQDIQMALVLGLTLIFTVIVSKSIGCLLPILVKKIKKDPAVVAAPLLTTVIDLCAIVIYFQIATSILTGIKGV